MAVAGIARDSEGVDRGNPAKYQGDLGFRERRRAGHEGDIAHRPVAAEGDVEECGADSTGEDAALDGPAAVVWDIEDQLVDYSLGGQASGGKKELLVWVLATVDAGKNGRPTIIQTDRGVKAERERRQEVGALV